MRSFRSRIGSTIIVGALVAACGSPASPAPVTSSSSTTPGDVASATPNGATVQPFASSIATPSPAAAPASADLPIRGSAREISDQEARLAPGREGSLYVSISVRNGPAVLLLLDRTGRPRPGWPVAIKNSTRCGPPYPLDDGSVRIVCDARDLPPPELDAADVRAFGFDADGRLIDGWPVRLPALYAASVVGTDLAVLTARSLGDTFEPGQISQEMSVTTVGADGSVRTGVPVGFDETCCGIDRLAVGSDGVAYGVSRAEDDAETDTVAALDRAGMRAGWPVKVSGYASAPAFQSDGRIVVTLGSAKRHTTRIAALDAGGTGATSGPLPMATVERTGDVGGCSVFYPRAPLASQGRTTYVYSELDPSIYALDPSLAIMRGWPFEPRTILETARPGRESEHEAGYCPTPVVPGIAPDGTLVLALVARNGSVGGSLVAVGPNARVRTGWPVEIKRAGSEFWSVAVGGDGTVYALAIEPEAGDASSASILAVAPDSSVRWVTTIIDP